MATIKICSLFYNWDAFKLLITKLPVFCALFEVNKIINSSSEGCGKPAWNFSFINFLNYLVSKYWIGEVRHGMVEAYGKIWLICVWPLNCVWLKHNCYLLSWLPPEHEYSLHKNTCPRFLLVMLSVGNRSSTLVILEWKTLISLCKLLCLSPSFIGG